MYRVPQSKGNAARQGSGAAWRLVVRSSGLIALVSAAVGTAGSMLGRRDATLDDIGLFILFAGYSFLLGMVLRVVTQALLGMLQHRIHGLGRVGWTSVSVVIGISIFVMLAIDTRPRFIVGEEALALQRYLIKVIIPGTLHVCVVGLWAWRQPWEAPTGALPAEVPALVPPDSMDDKGRWR